MEKYMRSRNHFRHSSGGGSAFLTVLLLIVVFAAGFFVSKLTVGNSLDVEKLESQIYAQLRSEAKNAVTYTNRLSRNNGTSSDYQTLISIEEAIHGMELLNDLAVSTFGEQKRVYTAEELSNAQSCAEAFLDKLNSGTRVADALTALSEAINVLYDKTVQVLGD